MSPVSAPPPSSPEERADQRIELEGVLCEINNDGGKRSRRRHSGPPVAVMIHTTHFCLPMACAPRTAAGVHPTDQADAFGAASLRR